MCVLQNMYEDVHWVWLQTEKLLIPERIYGTIRNDQICGFPFGLIGPYWCNQLSVVTLMTDQEKVIIKIKI